MDQNEPRSRGSERVGGNGPAFPGIVVGGSEQRKWTSARGERECTAVGAPRRTPAGGVIAPERAVSVLSSGDERRQDEGISRSGEEMSG